MYKAEIKKEQKDPQLPIYVFLSTSLGAFVGLLAYLKDWI